MQVGGAGRRSTVVLAFAGAWALACGGDVETSSGTTSSETTSASTSSGTTSPTTSSTTSSGTTSTTTSSEATAAPADPGCCAGATDGEALRTALPADAHGEPEAILNDMTGEPDGQTVPLTRDLVVQGVPCASGHPLNLLADRWVCTTSRATKLGGVDVAKGQEPAIYYGGAVAGAPISGTATLEGVPCKDWANFAEDGSVESCTLAASHDFGHGVQLDAGAELGLEHGRLTSAYLDRGQTVAGVAYEANHQLTIGEDGQVTDEGEPVGD